ncbi:MAG: steroid delta-isomerase [Rhodanobacter sp.]|nr:MAG: steroid delta-isomerase [Rhodanobacter sp.]TAM11692.1 MAG: steroid delta-isomerase [Rhodanobacter sp.]TAM37595.1 MAG: steroid delta-isomerase [Rhodanobacter sp.]
MIDTVHAYVRALNAGNADAVVALYAEDAVVEDPVGTLPRRGRVAIREFYRASCAMRLDVALESDVRAAARSVAFAFRVRLVDGGQPLTIHPIDVFDFDGEGRIAHMRAYFGPTNIQHA